MINDPRPTIENIKAEIEIRTPIAHAIVHDLEKSFSAHAADGLTVVLVSEILGATLKVKAPECVNLIGLAKKSGHFKIEF